MKSQSSWGTQDLSFCTTKVIRRVLLVRIPSAKHMCFVLSHTDGLSVPGLDCLWVPDVGLLQGLPGYNAAHSDLQLEAWLITWALLEDEDKAVRTKSARCLGSAIPHLGGPELSASCIELIQQQAWACITKTFSDSLRLLTFLCHSLSRYVDFQILRS